MRPVVLLLLLPLAAGPNPLPLRQQLHDVSASQKSVVMTPRERLGDSNVDSSKCDRSEVRPDAAKQVSHCFPSIVQSSNREPVRLRASA